MRRVEDRDGYFNEGGWRAGVGPEAPGAALLVLRLKGSDRIRAGELHVGPAATRRPWPDAPNRTPGRDRRASARPAWTASPSPPSRAATRP
ncbi:hypothetical protein HML84_12160 [Alcanivorax sp. IO_7]|nr:hypothetical protein HML84_12160 [Alcanivorax sp. IO_7]